MFVDDQAGDEQFDEPVQVFGGQPGGPMAALAPLVGKVVGAERAPIEISEGGLPVRFDGMFHPAGRT